VLDLYADAGGNFIDTADLYGGGRRASRNAGAGQAEVTVGRVIAGRRDRFVLATKGYWQMEADPGPNAVGLSRKHLVSAIDASLRRLGCDYIDLYQCHAWDFYTPVAETIGVLEDAVQAGKIRYFGVSNWDGWHVVKAVLLGGMSGRAGPISNQIWYTLADRSAENSVIPACRDQAVGIIAWGVLANGLLTGKYRRGQAPPSTSERFQVMRAEESSSWNRLATDQNWATLELILDLAAAHHVDPGNIATKWLLDRGNCDVALIGGSTVEHYERHLGTLDVRLSPSEFEAIDRLSAPARPYPVNLLEIFCRRESPDYGGLR
jgi:aryl-alcohol dehydrogenase (NADP+)